MSSSHDKVLDDMKSKIEGRESLFLPMATIFETGNHISQNGDGNQRRDCAKRFAQQVTLAIDGESPFTPINFVEAEEMRTWLSRFPDAAMQEMGLGDLSIIHDWERQRDLNQGRRVYIWSLDNHLQGFDTHPPAPR